MTGVDLLSHLAATDSHIPVIMLTAHGDDETRWRYLEARDTRPPGRRRQGSRVDV